MANKYKLTYEKHSQPELSCSGLIPLINEHFQANLSKSLINTVIKENNLSFRVAESIRPYLSDLSTFQLQEMVEALIYQSIFNDTESLGRLLDREILPENLIQYAQKLAPPFSREFYLIA